MKSSSKIIIALLLIKILLIGSLISIIKMNELKYYLPLPIKDEIKKELVETREYLEGDPFKIQRWLDKNITGKREAIHYAQSPEETFERKTGDCEDYAIIAKYFLGVKYSTIHIVVWEGKFLPESKYYKKVKGIVIHAICLFEIEDGWGVLDNNGLLMAFGTIEDAVKFDCKLRHIKPKRAFIIRFYRYAYRRTKKLNLEE